MAESIEKKTRTYPRVGLDTLMLSALVEIKSKRTQYDIFTITEVLSVCTALPKEYFMDEMLKLQKDDLKLEVQEEDNDGLTAKAIAKDIKAALKQFGEYAYNDKGAAEVMDMQKYADAIKEMPAEESIAILNRLEKMEPDNAGPFLSELFCSLETWEGPEAEKLFESEIAQEWY